MNVAVRFYSRSGNTKLLANAVAAAAGVTAESVDTPLDERVDLLLLGSSLYKAGIDPSIAGFIEANAANIGRIAVFGSAASGRSTLKKVAAVAEKYGVRTCDDFFACPGEFLFLNKGRPNDADLAKAADWAKRLVNG